MLMCTTLLFSSRYGPLRASRQYIVTSVRTFLLGDTSVFVMAQLLRSSDEDSYLFTQLRQDDLFSVSLSDLLRCNSSRQASY